MTILADTWQAARKNHTCDACLGTISRGDRYRRQRLISDGDPCVYKCHRLCNAVYWKVHRALGLHSDDGIEPDEIRHELALIFAGLPTLVAA